MVLGCYYLTANNPSEQKNTDQYFYSFEDVLTAYKQSIINLHTFVWVRVDDAYHVNLNSKFIDQNYSDKVVSTSPDIQLKKMLMEKFYRHI